MLEASGCRMAYFLFVDESGQDHRESPYEVLAGIAVQDRDLWNLVKAVQDTELKCFGVRYSAGPRELKAKKILKRKVFRLADQMALFTENDRTPLAHAALVNGASANKAQLTALAQAKLAYVSELFEICARYRVKIFASMVKAGASDHPVDYLRKDYAFLFERFFYFLEDTDPNASGIIVFDELEKSRSHLLVNQMDRYFKRTQKGRTRAGQIVPEPFFVHSDLTTGIQIADLVAYILSWGFRTPELELAKRDELEPFIELVCRLRHRAIRQINNNPRFIIWSIAVTDLAPDGSIV